MELRKLYDEEFDLYFSPNVIRMGWARHASERCHLLKYYVSEAEEIM
jgi:hypothetical protein